MDARALELLLLLHQINDVSRSQHCYLSTLFEVAECLGMVQVDGYGTCLFLQLCAFFRNLSVSFGVALLYCDKLRSSRSKHVQTAAIMCYVEKSIRTGSRKRRNVFAMRNQQEMSVGDWPSLARRVLARELYATERVTLNKMIYCAVCA